MPGYGEVDPRGIVQDSSPSSAGLPRKAAKAPEESICQYAAENFRLLGGVPQRQPFCIPTTESMLPALWADSESLGSMTLMSAPCVIAGSIQELYTCLYRQMTRLLLEIS